MRHSWLPCSRTLSRRAVLLLGGATLFAAPAVWAQTPGRTWRWPMPHYFFDIKDGHRLTRPGLIAKMTPHFKK
jgi:hypothetical protein